MDRQPCCSWGKIEPFEPKWAFLFLFFSPLLRKASDMKAVRTRALEKGRGGFPEPRWAIPLRSPSLMPLGEGHSSGWGPGPPPRGTGLTPDPGILFAPYSQLCLSSVSALSQLWRLTFPRGAGRAPSSSFQGPLVVFAQTEGAGVPACFCLILLPTIKSGLWGQSLFSQGL